MATTNTEGDERQQPARQRLDEEHATGRGPLRVLRHYPAVLWAPVYVGSLLVLNGAHPDWRPGQLAAGIACILLAGALSTYLAIGPWPGRPRPRGMGWAISGVAAFYVICAIAAGAFVGFAAALACLLAGLIPLTAVAIWVAHARAKTRGSEQRMRHADAPEDEDPVPGIGFEDGRPMGDSSEIHSEINPHDLPKDHPGRKAAERQAEARDGTTPGHAQGADTGDSPGPPAPTEDLVHDDEVRRGARISPGRSRAERR
jgi:hypothetical protein